MINRRCLRYRDMIRQTQRVLFVDFGGKTRIALLFPALGQLQGGIVQHFPNRPRRVSFTSDASTARPGKTSPIGVNIAPAGQHDHAAAMERESGPARASNKCWHHFQVLSYSLFLLTVFRRHCHHRRGKVGPANHFFMPGALTVPKTASTPARVYGACPLPSLANSHAILTERPDQASLF